MNLKQLSEVLGLSPTTVSRALNGYPEVARATRLRVVQAARDHNYRPNARAKGLATGRAMAIGHVIPVSTRNEVVNPVFADFIAGAGETYQKHGYDMLLSMIADSDQETVYRELASKGSVDGIIVQSPQTGDPRIPLLRDLGLPFVVHGRASSDDTEYSWVDINNRRAFQRATDFLIDLGHRRIALLNGPDAMDFTRRRLRGYTDTLQLRGIAADPQLILNDDMTEEYGHAAAQSLLALPDPPTGFLTSSIIIAIGVRRAVESAGLHLGRDISVITHDDELSYLKNGGDVPTFTATRSSVRHAGRLCAEMLIGLVQSPDPAPRQTLLEVELTLGQSTGPMRPLA